MNPWGAMSVFELSYLGFIGVVTAALTAIVGYGGGTILMAVLLQTMPPAVAIPFHGAVQIFSNGWRVFLFWEHISWPLTLRFLAFLPFGVAIGLWFFQGLPKEAIAGLIGGVVLISLFTRQLKSLRNRDLPTWAFFPLGFVVGILNMMVGVVAPLLGVLTIRRDLNKEQMVATLGSFALVGHISKIVAFGLVGFRYEDYLVPLAVLAPAVMVGGYLGKYVLGWISEYYFQIGFKAVLLLLGLKLVFWDFLGGVLA